MKTVCVHSATRVFFFSGVWGKVSGITPPLHDKHRHPSGTIFSNKHIWHCHISKEGLHLHNPACMASGITWVKVLGFRGADGLDRTAEQTLHFPRHS